MAVVYTLPTTFQPSFATGIFSGSDLNQAVSVPVDATYSGLTALSGGGTTGATPLLYAINHVTTTAANNDSVKLPAAKIGAAVVVINAGSSTLAVFPQTADKINSGTAGASTTQATLVTGTYFCPIANNWFRVTGS